MSAVKTGAIMLLEKDVPLGDLERTGIAIDALVTNQLIINIFEKNKEGIEGYREYFRTDIGREILDTL